MCLTSSDFCSGSFRFLKHRNISLSAEQILIDQEVNLIVEYLHSELQDIVNMKPSLYDATGSAATLVLDCCSLHLAAVLCCRTYCPRDVHQQSRLYAKQNIIWKIKQFHCIAYLDIHCI